MDHEHSERVAAAPDRVYAALSPRTGWRTSSPQLTAVRATQGETVEVEARYGGVARQGEAWLRTDGERRRIEWGVQAGAYRGSLQVDPDGEGSKLTLRITTARAGDAEREVAETLGAIKRLLEAEI